MTVSLSKPMEKYVKQKLANGGYKTPEAVVQAALAAMRQSESFGDFAPGELMRLIEEGEESIRRHGTLDGEKARQMRKRRRIRLGKTRA